MVVALTFLLRYYDEDNEYLNRIVTDDKTWIDNSDKLAPFPDSILL